MELARENYTKVPYEKFKKLIHAETQLGMIKKSIEEMEISHTAEEILEDIKMTIRI